MYLRLIHRFFPVGFTLAALMFCCLAVTLRAEEIDNASARAYNSAAALQNAGLHTRAAKKWSSFISQFPDDQRIGRAHYYLAVCALRERKFNDAAQKFQNVLTKFPKLEQADKAQYNLAMSGYEMASAADDVAGFRKAAADFERVFTIYPNSDLVDESVYYRGDSLFNSGDLAGAAIAYQKLITEHSSSPHAARAYYDLGITQQELEKPSDAVRTFQTFLNKPQYASHELADEIRLRLAICLHNTKQLEAAAEQFDKVSQIADFELAPYAAYRFGQTQQEQQKFIEAATRLINFPKRFPQSEYRAEALKTAGHCYLLADKPQDAIRVLSPVANSDDKADADVAAEAAYWLGRSQLKLKKPDQALATLQKAIGRFPNSPFTSYLTFARIDSLYEIPKRRTETPPLYEAFLRDHPTHALAPQAAYMAALSSFGQQQYRKAREVAESYLAKPENDSTTVAPDIMYIAAEAYLLESPSDVSARKKAENIYRDLVTKHADHARATRSHLRIGWCLSADQPQDAIRYLRGVLSKFDKQQQLPEAHLLIGRSHAKLNQHREAITAFNASIASGDKWDQIDEVLLAAAESHRALDELDPATVHLRRLVKTQPKSPQRAQALYWLGEIAEQRKQHDEAINWFNQVADQFPKSEFGGPAMHALAAVYLSKGQYPQTRQWASRLIDGKIDDTLTQRGHYLRGLAYHREGEFAKAIADLNAYRANPVDDGEAVGAAYTLVLCQIAEKQFDAARSLLAELLKSNPDFPHADTAYYELGHALRSQENKGIEAADAFQWIADHRPDSVVAAESWFRVAQQQSEHARQAMDEQKNAAYNLAETSLKKGLEKVKDAQLNENMLYLLGNLQFQQMRFADAIKTLTKQMDQFQNGKYVGQATFLAAQSRYQLQQFDSALPLFAKLGDASFADTSEVQIDSFRSQALYRAGDCASKLKRWKESQTYFRKLLDQHPKFPQRSEALYGIAHALQQQDQLDRAIEIYEQVTQSSEAETAAKARFMVGEIEFGRKKYEDAIEQFLTVTVGYPYKSWQSLARFETARCFLELGDKDRAIKTLREMIEQHPDHARTNDAKKMLDDLNQ